MGYAILDQRGGDSLTATTLDGYSLLADTTVSSATTTIDFTGLNISWGEELLMVSNIVGITNYSDIVLYCNSNYTNTNYYSQYLVSTGTTVVSGRLNMPYIANPYNAKTFTVTKIKLTNNGYFVYQANTEDNSGTSGVLIYNSYGTSTFVTSNITSLRMSSTVSNGINVGSRFQLYKSGGGASRTWAIT